MNEGNDSAPDARSVGPVSADAVLKATLHAVAEHGRRRDQRQ